MSSEAAQTWLNLVPDALPDQGDPRMHFDAPMAAEALDFAEKILNRVAAELQHG